MNVFNVRKCFICIEHNSEFIEYIPYNVLIGKKNLHIIFRGIGLLSPAPSEFTALKMLSFKNQVLLIVITVSTPLNVIMNNVFNCLI